MKTFFRRGIALVLMCVAAVGVMNAQEPQLPPMPVDPAVRTGQLDNGLTYYIRHNETPKGQADFYIAQKVGSILEEDNQQGLAHFLEHMCFNGTKHFPNNTLIDWLESVGVKFGYNLNAYTSIDETVYNISSVPVARQSVQDSCLLILHDWACDLTLDPEEIDKERGVIHEEWRRTTVGEMRAIEKISPNIYPGNKYGVRWPIGTMEVVDNFKPQALRDYYETWYRPDQQGIIVVGDIDVDYIEGKIKELFAPIPMPANAKVREYIEVDDTPGTLYGIATDKEITAPSFMLMFKTDVLIPREIRNTQAFYPTYYVKRMINSMMNARLNEIAQNPNANFAQAGASIGDYFLSKTKDAVTLQGYTKGNDIIPGLKEAYREVLRASRGGFTVSEYERAKAEFLSQIEKQYDSRNNTQTERYTKEYVRSFIDNTPIPGIEIEKEIFEQFAPMISVDMINTLLPQIILQDNRAFVALLPENDTMLVPTEEQIAAALAEVEAEEIEPYRDAMKEEPLIPSLPKAGSVKSSKELKEWDATEYTLSNGVKVIVKPTTFKENEIKFYAIAKGGISTIGDKQVATLKSLDYTTSQHGLGTYTDLDLQKYLQGKQASVSLDLSNYSRSLTGASTVKDLPTLMELIYMNFVDFNITEDEFSSTQSAVASMLANQETNPQYLFSKGILASLFKAKSRQAITADDIKAADRQATLDIVHSMVANAADFTFVFTGNIDMESFKPLMEQYIATLPVNAKKSLNSVTNRADIEPELAASNIRETTKMETPQSWVFIGSLAKVPYTAENKAIISIASQILSNRLLKKVREEMGATYSIGANGSLDRLSNANTFFQIAFPMKPEMKDEVLPIIKEIVENMAKTVTADELNPIKEYMIKSAKESYEDNYQWASAIASTTLNGVQTFTNQIDVVNAITVDKVQKLMAEILKQGNYRVYVLDPAE